MKGDQSAVTTLSEALSSDQVEIKSWDEFQNHLKEYRGDHRYKWCFRGQADARWGLVPSLERLVPRRNNEDPAHVEKVLLNRFKRQAHHFLPKLPAETEFVEWFGLMQHWGVPTRLLDFTLSPYIALFFALRDHDFDSGKSTMELDGESACSSAHAAVWAIHHVALQNIAKGELNMPGTDSGTFRREFDHLLSKGTDIDFVAPVQPFLMNERIATQQGLFLCPTNLRLPFEVIISQPEVFRIVGVYPKTRKVKSDFARKLIIPRRQRAEMLRELLRMNINSASLFPGLEGYARAIREGYEILEGEAPVYKQIALGTLDDFGWTG